MGFLDDLIGKKQHTIDNRTDTPLGDWARKYKWSYVRRDDRWADKFRGLPHFDDNDGKQAWDVIRGGHRGRRVDAFQYFWERELPDRNSRDRDRRERYGRERREFHKYMVVNVLTPREQPALTVTKEMWDSKFDLDLESVEFNKTFKVKVKREHQKFAYDVLHPQMMEFLLADERAMEFEWPFRFERGDLYTWEEWEPSLDMRAVMHKANFLIDILERVPESVWKDQP